MNTVLNKVSRMSDEDSKNVVDLAEHRLKLAGGGGDGYNWLSNLDVGTIFLARPKGDFTVIELMCYKVVDKSEKGTGLFIKTPTAEVFTWVDTNRFSNKLDLVEVLMVQKPDGSLPDRVPDLEQ